MIAFGNNYDAGYQVGYRKGFSDARRSAAADNRERLKVDRRLRAEVERLGSADINAVDELRDMCAKLKALQPLAAPLIKWLGIDGPNHDAKLEQHMAEGENELIEVFGEDAIEAIRWLAKQDPPAGDDLKGETDE